MRNFAKILFLFLGLAVLPMLVFASETNGTIDLTHKYAWSENGGWINFGCANCNVQITDSAVTGYAWSENYGWIKLNPEKGGVVNTEDGELSGSAWGENVGWINFTGVYINDAGQFTGGTVSNDVLGQIVFSECGDNCKVVTDWRTASTRTGGSENPVTPSGGGGGGGTVSAPTSLAAPNGGFKAVINQGAPKTKSRIVDLYIEGGTDAVKVQISNKPDFANAVPEVYTKNKIWMVTAGDGVKTVYVKFLGTDGKTSATTSASIVLDTVLPIIKITQLKTSYAQSEEVVFRGSLTKPGKVIFYWDNQYGSINTDEKGLWAVNLGVLLPGVHTVLATAKDDLGNSTNKTLNVTVLGPGAVPVKSNFPLPQIVKNITEKIIPQKTIPKIVTIPKDSPTVLDGKWSLIKIKK